MFKGIDHVEIIPSNLERTLNFYTEILGGKIQWRHKIERPPAEEVIFIELGGSLIEVFSVKKPAPVSTEQWQIGYRRFAL
jgi:glyoxylase I family protein